MGKTDEGATGATGATGTTTPPAAAAPAAAAPAAAAAAAPATEVKDEKGGATGATGTEGNKDGAAPAAPAAAAPEVPEKYDLKLPEGDWLEAGDLTAIERIAREEKWTNEQAQAAVDKHADGLAAQSEFFRAATEADPTWGGEHLQETQRLATTFLDRVEPKDTPEGKEIRRILARSGYGNNLAVVRLLAKAGKMMAEDSPGGGASGSTVTKDLATTLYGKTKE